MFISEVLIIIITFGLMVTGKYTYIITERPVVTYFNIKYVDYFNVTSQRYSRLDPFYYVGIHWIMNYPVDNNVTIHYIFYEFLSNRYKRSFIEMSFMACDLVHKDKFLGVVFRQGKLKNPCPFPAGEYHLYNLTIPFKKVPANFPFTKGRIMCNITSTATREVLVTGHIDMELKEFRADKKIKEINI